MCKKILISTFIAAATMIGTTAFADNYTGEVHITSDKSAIFTRTNYSNNVISGNVTINEGATWKWGVTTGSDSGGTGHGLVLLSGTLAGAGTLEFTRTQNGGASPRFLNLTGTQGTDGFTGTIKLTNSNTDTSFVGPNVVLILNSTNIAAQATVNLASAYTGIIFGANSTQSTIGGLNGVANTWVIGKSVTPTSEQTNKATDANWWKNDATAHTLTLVGGEGKSYTFEGTIGSVENREFFNISKTGAGTQTFSGSVYAGNISVSAGTLAFTGAQVVKVDTIDVSAGTLKDLSVGEETTVNVTNPAAVLSNVTLAGGTLDLTKASNSNTSTVTLNSGRVKTSAGKTTLSGIVTFSDPATNVVFDLIGATVGTKYEVLSAENLTENEWGKLTNVNFNVNGAGIGGRGSVSLETPGDVVIEVVSWQGGVGNNVWNTAANNTNLQLPDGTSTYFINGDAVEFGSSAVEKSVVIGDSLSAESIFVTGGDYTFSPASGLETPPTLTINAISVSSGASASFSNALVIGSANNLSFFVDANASSTVSGGLSGAGMLTKSGAGTLILSGDNTYSDGTTISAGTLQVGNGGTTGTLGSGNVSIASGANLLINRDGELSISGAISGAGSLTKSGAGTLTLSAGNLSAFTGTLNATAGIVNMGTGLAGYNPGYTLGSFDGATLQLGLTNSYGNTVNLGAGFAGTANITAGYFTINSNIGSGTYELAGGVNLQAAATATASNNIILDGTTQLHTNSDVTLTLTGNISGVGTLDKRATGTLILAGENTISGGITVSAGTLQVDTNSALGTSSVSLAGGTTLSFVQGGASSISNAISLNGAAIISAEAGMETTLSGIVSGSGALTKTGAGTLTLSGANTNTGNVIVNGGTLILRGTNKFTQTFTVNSGATLDLMQAVRSANDNGNGILTIAGGLVKIANMGWGANANFGANYNSDRVKLSAGGVLEITNAQMGVGRGFTILAAESGTIRYSGDSGTYEFKESGDNHRIIANAGSTLAFDVVNIDATILVSKKNYRIYKCYDFHDSVFGKNR